MTNRFTFAPPSFRAALTSGSVRTKLVRTVVGIVSMVCVLIVGAVAWLSAQNQHQHAATIADNIHSALINQGRLLSENQSLALREMVQNNAFGDVQLLTARTVRDNPDILMSLFVEEGGRAWSYSAPGLPELDEDALGAPPSDNWKKLQVGQLKIGDSGFGFAEQQWFNEPVLAFAQHVTDAEGELLGTVYYAFSKQSMTTAVAAARKATDDELKRTLLILGGLAAFGLMLAWGLGRMQAKRITEPLQTLTDVAVRIAKGERDERAIIHCGDEIEVLAGAFNHMVDDLARSHRELEVLNRELEAKVAERTREVSKMNAEMTVILDNVTDGLATMDREGNISGARSEQFQQLFGAPLNDSPMWEALSRGDQNLAGALRASWDQVVQGFLPRDMALEQMPQRLAHEDRFFDLRFQPLVDEQASEPDDLRGALIVTKDVTAQLEAQKKAAEQAELLSIFQQITQDRRGFDEFTATTQGQLNQLQSRELTCPNEAMRVLHTLKGNCSLYGVDSLARHCHDLESWLIDNASLPETRQFAPLMASWQEFLRRVHSLTGESDTTGYAMSEKELERLVDLAQGGDKHAKLIEALLSLRDEPVTKRFTHLGKQAAVMAEKCGKANLSIVIQDAGLRLPSERFAPFWSSVVHAVRNAVDHGIESPAAREATGKDVAGTLEFSAERAGRETLIRLRDDGAGIEWEKIRVKAEELGLPHANHGDLVSALFADGFSSREEVTELSGRGVGMAALKEAVNQLDGNIELKSTLGQGTTVTFRFPSTSA